MREPETKELTEKQQLLLSTYADNECSLFSRWMAERLIKSNPDAQLFIDTLKNNAHIFRTATTADDSSADLWSKISQRIDAEERAAIYLGDRKPVVQDGSIATWSNWLSRHAVMGGLSGAAIAAMVLVLVTRPSKPGEILPVYTGGPVAAQGTSPFRQAAFNAAGTAGRSTMEVDWMRANGSLQLIQNPTGKSAIIWVRKKNPAARNQQRNVFATPTIRVLPQEGLDAQPLGRAK